MANVRDSDTSLWLHNKLGTSNDSWISGSICSQLNKEVLRNIKECFPDLQTQVKLKLLLSFFHIPRRLVEEWKTELEEVIEVAGLDSELWVSMLAETMKTFPATSSLNTEISEYEDTRPIFTDMVNDLRKLVSKHCDIGMLPLECLYLNKNALVSVVGQQQNPVKHFTIKRKPKSANLRTELLHKSADAQSSLKKSSAPTIPLRSRGMPRKMTDTTPLKGIPSRVPSLGFRSPNVSGTPQRPNLSRTPAGRKDGGIKLIEFTEQPLGYAAAKKRKREQQLEEQQKKQEQKLIASAAAAENASPTAISPTQGSGVSTTAGNAATPTTPTSSGAAINSSFEIKTETVLHLNQSGTSDDMLTDIKDNVLATKIEPPTPEYAQSLSYTQPTSPKGSDSKSQIKSLDMQSLSVASTVLTPTTSVTVSTPTKMSSMSTQTQTRTPTQTQSSNTSNNLNHSHKRIKQEIEIKSEEILMPPNIKVEKIEPQTQPPLLTQQLPQTPSRLQQRIIIQQQKQPQQQSPQTQPTLQQQTTQHVLIRSAPQQQKQTLSGLTLGAGGAIVTRQKINTTTTSPTNSNTMIKMEKLDINPMVSKSPVTNTMPTNIYTQQQLRQTNNPLANLPNNISVKITSSKSAKVQSLPQQNSQQQQQQPILINSSTPVIISSSAAPVSRPKQLVPSGTSTTTTAQSIKSMPLSQLKTAANSGPVIISQTIIQPAKRSATSATSLQTHQQQQQQLLTHHQPQQQQQQQQPQHQQSMHQSVSTSTTGTQYILTTSGPQPQQQHQHAQQLQTAAMPTLASFSHARPTQQSTTTVYQTAASANTQTPTKIILKTSPSGVMMTPLRQQQAPTTASGNPPPLIATSTTQQQQPALLNIQNVQLPNRPVTIQPASQAAQQQHLQAQLQQQQPQHTIVSNTSATQQPKLTQVLVQSANPTGVGGSVGNVGVANANTNMKNKTIILTQKGVILRNIGGDMYQQIPISNMSGLQGLSSGTGATLMTTAAGPPSLVKSTSSGVQPGQTIQLQQQSGTQAKPQQHLPTLIPTNTLTSQHMIVQQPTQTNLISAPSQQTIIRPVISNVQGNSLTTLPQGLTLIQRPGQQPQLVQVQTPSGSTAVGHQLPTQIQRTIITQPAQQQQMRSQQIVLQHKSQPQQRIITTTQTGTGQPQHIQIQQGTPTGGISRTTHIVQVSQQAHQQQQQQPQSQQAPQRKGLSLSNEHVHKAHEMFRKANRVSRPDKALILGFMAGMRENPRPNSENVIVIKLGESEEKVQQEDGSTALCLVESHIRLDYNTGEWKTFQNYRRLDQSVQGQGVDGTANSGTGGAMQTQNSVVI
ncbi:negative elongation factor A [Rhagoletis pomonella]|uniref:negative elongation factor A n=1 Tax=Rhagoletis pomonella TaxID=28610 RepID=UPI00177B9BA2|nr:negative elongation factor A [Rhagoletis pomonella]